MPTAGTIRITDSAVEFLLDEPQLTEHKIHAIADQLNSVAEQAGQSTLRLDFHRVEYLTSAVLGKVVALHKRMKNSGGSLQVVNLSAELYDLFHITRLNTIIDIRMRSEHLRIPSVDGPLAAQISPN